MTLDELERRFNALAQDQQRKFEYEYLGMYKQSHERSYLQGYLDAACKAQVIINEFLSNPERMVTAEPSVYSAPDCCSCHINPPCNYCVGKSQAEADGSQ